MDFHKELKKEEYNFLRNNPMLKDKILFLVVSGSYAYGTNVETSDLDLRGVYLERETDTLGLTDVELYADKSTDTVLYSLKKFLRLVRDCNPTVIEMLYANKEHYLYVSKLGQILIDNRDLFLTKRAAYSFEGYANAQYNRLENALARDVVSEHESLEHVNRSITNVVKSFELKFGHETNSISTYVSKVDGENEDIFVDIMLKSYPLRKLKSVVDEMNNVFASYKDKRSVRNTIKKKDNLLNKHMMHTARLYYMYIDILKYNTFNTYREKERQILLDIRMGKYRNNDGTVKEEYYALLDNLKKESIFWKLKSNLRNQLDTDNFNDFVLQLY